MKDSTRDIFAGSFLILCSLMLHMVIIPWQVKTRTAGPIALSPSLFCHIITALLLLLSIILLFNRLKNKFDSKNDIQRTQRRDFRISRAIIAVIASIIYILGIEPLGYFSSTALAMVFFLYFFGARSITGFLTFLTIMLITIYFLFVKALNVILPSGVLF